MAVGIADPPRGYGLSEGRLSSTRTPTPAYPARNPSRVSKPLTITTSRTILFHSTVLSFCLFGLAERSVPFKRVTFVTHSSQIGHQRLSVYFSIRLLTTLAQLLQLIHFWILVNSRCLCW